MTTFPLFTCKACTDSLTYEINVFPPQKKSSLFCLFFYKNNWKSNDTLQNNKATVPHVCLFSKTIYWAFSFRSDWLIFSKLLYFYYLIHFSWWNHLIYKMRKSKREEITLLAIREESGLLSELLGCLWGTGRKNLTYKRIQRI